MEGMTRHQKRIGALLELIPVISEALCRTQDWLLCHDQEKELIEAVEDVVKRVQIELSREYFAFQVRSEKYFQQEMMGLVAQVAKSILGSQGPPQPDNIPEPAGIGKVLIAVGPDGIPVNLSVVNVSDLAHWSGMAAESVEKVFTDKGHVLFTLQGFQEFAAWLQTEVLSGRVHLPYHPATVTTE